MVTDADNIIRLMKKQKLKEKSDFLFNVLKYCSRKSIKLYEAWGPIVNMPHNKLKQFES